MQFAPTSAVSPEGGGISALPPAFPSTHLGEGGPAANTWEDTMRARPRLRVAVLVCSACGHVQLRQVA
jgi:hypothetical protein